MTRTAIDLPYPETSDRHLKISVGACHLIIRPGESSSWVSGAYIDPVGILPLKINREGGETRLTQELNPVEISGGFQGRATLELELGQARPYWLTVESGASEVEIDLGGLPVSRLNIRGAAGNYIINFSTPNPQALILLSVTFGVGVVEFNNLSNANLVEMLVEGAAATYRLDWGTNLIRPARVRIATGISLIEMTFPSTVPALITADTRIGNTEVDEGVIEKDGGYWTQAALDGGEPRLTVRANLAFGTLRLNSRKSAQEQLPPVADEPPGEPPSPFDRVEI